MTSAGHHNKSALQSLFSANIRFLRETLGNRVPKPHLTCERLVRYRETCIAVPKSNIVQLCMLAR
jgi:hypothetical protein